MYPIIETCPVCSHQLHVTKLSCSNCNTVIENDFTLSKFASFTPEQLTFIEVFLLKRGNIKEVEKAMGISYPTVRSKLNAITAKLGQQPSESDEMNEAKERRAEVIAKLNSEEISLQQALDLLQKNDGSGKT